MSSSVPEKRLILLASSHSYRGHPFERAAQRLDIKVIKGKDVPLPMLKQLKDDGILALDYRDLKKSIKEIKRYVSKHPVAAIIGLDDSGTLLAAAASEKLGLNHNSPDATKAARNKYLMRQKFAEVGAPSPKFQYFRLHEDPNNVVASVNYPCVIKPITLSGSRGVMRADSPGELLQRIRRLKAILAADRCDEFLVEDFIPGVEVALEGILDQGELNILAMFDKPDPLNGPFFEETIYVTPSRLTDQQKTEVIKATRIGCQALGLQNGPVHAELRVNDAGAWLVEIASRSIGGMCSESLHFNMDMTLEELILRQAFGMDISGAHQQNGAEGVMMIPIPHAGILKRVEGIEEAKAVPGISKLEITANINYSLVPLPEGNSYLGFIFASGVTPEEVEKALREANSRLHFDIVEEIRLEVRRKS